MNNLLGYSVGWRALFEVTFVYKVLDALVKFEVDMIVVAHVTASFSFARG
jgi:hypothetical protein